MIDNAHTNRKTGGVVRVLLRAATMIVSFVLALEIGLRIYNPFPFRVRGDHIVLPVHQKYTLKHAGALKLDPVTHVTKNSLGFRGPEPPRDWSHRLTVLTIGGSTTECLFLSDGKTWTDQLTRRLHAVAPDAWVNNAGFEGHSSFGHLVLLREYMAEMRPSVAIFLVGANDSKLVSPRPRDQELNPQNLSVGHRVLTFMADHSDVAAVGENLVRMRRTYEAGLGNDELHMDSLTHRPIHEEDKIQGFLDEHRQRFLAGYAQRMAEIVDISRQHGIEPILVTQPALYGDAIDPTTGISLETPAINMESNGHVEWLIMELYNDVLRALSVSAKVHLVDLAHELPKDSKYYSDWIHYTNEGAVLVGDIIFSHVEPWLLERAPAAR